MLIFGRRNEKGNINEHYERYDNNEKRYLSTKIITK